MNNEKQEELITPEKGSREYFEAWFKKVPFYWDYLHINTEISLEMLEELRTIRRLLEKRNRGGGK